MPIEVSSTKPDWTREACGLTEWRPGHQVVRAIRSYQRWSARRGPVARLLTKAAVLRHRFWSVAAGCEIPINSQLGGGFYAPHPVGIVIHRFAEIGPNCLLMHGVTVGGGGPIPGFPKLGGHVDVGCGAKILGGVTIGEHARIGANAVVLCDVPAGATAVGIPARVILPKRQPEPVATAATVEQNLDDSAILATVIVDATVPLPRKASSTAAA